MKQTLIILYLRKVCDISTPMNNILINKILLGIEFVLLFVGVPLFLFLDKDIIHPSIVLLPVVLLLFVYLYRNPEFSFRELIFLKIPAYHYRKAIISFLITAVLIFLGIYFFDRESLFNLPRGNLRIWILLCFFYPVFSAYLQEIVYRKFMFLRYKKLFVKPWMMILASGLSFGFMHIVYYNPLAIILTVIAGIYFAAAYYKTKSVMFSSILHGAFGDLVFTMGLGQYFWLDMYKYI